MSYIGAALLILFLLGLTSMAWYWLFKRFERRMSERFDDVTERTNENFRVLEVLMDRAYDLPTKLDQTNELLSDHGNEIERLQIKAAELDDKLDILQGLLLVIKQDRVLESALKAGRIYREEGRVDEQEIERLTELIEKMRLDNLSRY